jgi:(p)ppGpp synthase/HD superfamily hydrolase
VQTKEAKGAKHAREVAGLLRAARYPESVQVAGLLHDVVEDTPWTVEHVAARFGPGVARVVGALTEDDDIGSYRRRKRALREQIAAAGAPATDVALADKIASLCYLRVTGRRLRERKRARYEATLAIAAATARAGARERGDGPARRARRARRPRRYPSLTTRAHCPPGRTSGPPRSAAGKSQTTGRALKRRARTCPPTRVPARRRRTR